MSEDKNIPDFSIKGISLRKLYQSISTAPSPQKSWEQQKKVLHKLLENTCHTAFGRQYNFDKILEEEHVIEAYQKAVPIRNYEAMKEWWTRALNGESDVVTKGRLEYFALSSGTSDGASKYIPVSKKQLTQFKRQSVKLSLHIALNKDIPVTVFSKHHLLIGGSMNLKYNGVSYTGDLSGITQLKIPFWYQPFSKPGRDVMRMQWDSKIENIVRDAPDWNVSIITGVPSWVQIVLERIIERYKLKNIHELWPDLKVYIHSGIRAEPYYKSINSLFGEKVFWYESYLASEGFFAFKESDTAEGMKLILTDNNFFEFVPFDETNFDDTGNIKPEAKAFTIKDVKANTDYALLITTCSGAWRYLIGDVVRFTEADKAEIIVSGRTKHFLSVTGEHLSVDNMNKAIELASNTLGFVCKEFTVHAEPKDGQFIHVWHIGCDKPIDNVLLKFMLDEKLKELNDDYHVERAYALKDIQIITLSNDAFYEFLYQRGKAGGQIKFPRVLKGEILADWKKFVASLTRG